jgi:hypothetical protein
MIQPPHVFTALIAALLLLAYLPKSLAQESAEQAVQVSNEALSFYSEPNRLEVDTQKKDIYDSHYCIRNNTYCVSSKRFAG